jgi:FkbM family methyltransferase
MKLINGNEYELNLSKDFLKSHFEDRKNCTEEIIHQLNNGFYNEFIKNDNNVIVDLGANIGLFTTHVSPYFSKCISVEPTPSHFKILKELTKDIGKIQYVNAAISNVTGEMDFYLSETNSTMNSLSNIYGNSIKVKTYTLKYLLDKYDVEKVDFMKVDIEGSEVIFLSQSNIETMSKCVERFFIEFHDVNGKSYTEWRNIFKEVFIENGFDCEYVSVDALFCKNLKKL